MLTGIFAAGVFLERQEKHAQDPIESRLEARCILLAIIRFSDAARQQYFLDGASQIAFRAISVALDVHSGHSVCMFFAARPCAEKHALVLAALLATMAACAGAGRHGRLMVRHTWWDTEDIPVLLEAIRTMKDLKAWMNMIPWETTIRLAGKISAHEILARGARHRPCASGARIHVEHWSAEKKEMRVTSREPSRLALRLLNYPAWRVEVTITPSFRSVAEETPCK